MVKCLKGECRVLRVYSESHVDTKGFKYKVIDKMGTKVMERVFIYRYVSFVIGVLFLIGLILFSWIALRKIRGVPAR
jgi:hypothetical protein